MTERQRPSSDPTQPRTPARGRPPSTTPRELELIALNLFAEHGFEETTVEAIAAAANVTSRTFFRYFPGKADVLWQGFDDEIEATRDALGSIDPDEGIFDGIRTAVLTVNDYGPDDLPELRTRLHLLSNEPALQAHAALRYEAWAEAISAFVGSRTGQSPTALYPLVLGRAVLAACQGAFDVWADDARGEQSDGLVTHLDAALELLRAGFDS